MRAEDEIEMLERDREVWAAAARDAIAGQERLEREQGSATARILRQLKKRSG